MGKGTRHRVTGAHVAMLLGTSVVIAGCAAPARPSPAGLAATSASGLDDSSFFAGDAANPSTTPTPTTPWDGQYIVTLNTKWFGPVHARMYAEPTPNGFKANTPPNVAWSLVGGVEGSVGPLLMPFVFPRGMILTWNSSLAGKDGTPGEGSIGAGTLERLRLKTRISRPGEPVEIVFKDDRVVGTLTVQPVRDGATRVTDYSLLAQSIREKMPGALYDESLAQDAKVKAFFDDVALGAAKARDDLEFMFAGAAAARKNIEFQMPLVFPDGPSSASLDKLTTKALADRAYKAGPDNELAHVTVVRFDAFLDVGQVDEAMNLALKTHTAPRRGIILDLRTSTGVDVAAFRVAQWLIAEPLDAGAYVGSIARADGTPLTHVDVRDASDFAALSNILATQGGADITVWPLSEPRAYRGPVIVVTSERTSSTSEALVAALKRSGRVRVVGQPTAGRPLLGREVPLGQGWTLRVAGYDLLAPQGADAGLKDNRGVKGARPTRAQADGEPRAWQRSVVPDVRASGDGVDEARREMVRLLDDDARRSPR